jgi:hypothetical protein
MPSQLYQTLKETAINHVKAFESPDPFDPDQVSVISMAAHEWNNSPLLTNSW